MNLRKLSLTKETIWPHGEVGGGPPRDRGMVDFFLGHQVVEPERAPRCGLTALPDRRLAGAGVISIF
jgi:hypothetical protein